MYATNISDSDRSFHSFTTHVEPMTRAVGCGTSGSRNETLKFFSKDFYRALSYSYVDERSLMGISLYHYEMSDGTMIAILILL